MIILKMAANTAIPKTSGRRGKPSAPWWNPDCRKAIREKRRAERALHRVYSQPNMIKYKRAKAKCQYILNNARRKSWEKYVSDMTTNTRPKEIWKKIGKLRGKYTQSPQPILKWNDQMISDPIEVGNLLAESFASTDRHYDDEFLRYKEVEEQKVLSFRTNQQLPYNEAFSEEEFSKCLSSTKETSPGPDQITYSMIKFAHRSLKMNILRYYNRIFREETFPTAWQKSIIIPIPKPGKDPQDPGNYRPISLTSCICKLFERMVNHRLMWFLEKNEVINKLQSGFRKNRSTIDQLVQLSDALQGAIARREHSLVIFFDISKAYDSAWRYGIVRAIHESGLRGHLPSFIKNFLTRRSIAVRIGNQLSESIFTTAGIPQGSVLSCTCFMIAINKITDNLPQGVNGTLYVDDFSAYISGNNINSLERRLQLTLNNIEGWSKKTGFRMNKTKTVAMHICRKRNCPKLTPSLTLEGAALKGAEEYRFLGLIFDKSLTWRPHITNLKCKCIKTLNILKLLSNVKWGADQQILIRLYIMLIKPRLDYGVEAYSAAADSYIKSLNSIQNSAIRIATGAFKSSPIASLHALTGVKPIETFREIKMITFFLRLMANPTHPLHQIALRHISDDPPQNQSPKIFFERTKRIISKYNLTFEYLMKEPGHQRPPWLLTNLQSCNELNNIKKNKYLARHLQMIYRDHFRKHDQDKVIFTDGSKSEDGVSYAAVSRELTISSKIQSTATIFTAELLAIHKSLHQTDENSQNTITIATDSKSSIQALTNYMHCNPLVQAIQDHIMALNRTIQLCWVPSHTGITLNERADSAARDAARNQEETPVDLPRADHKCKIRGTIIERWRQQWRDTRNNKLRCI